MKNILTRIFLKDKFIGQIAAAVASVAAAYIATYVPGVPEVILSVVTAAFDLPEGTHFDQAGITGVLTPVILAWINLAISEFVIRDNNKALEILSKTNLYNGPLDGSVGTQAQAAISILVARDNKPTK